jgi:aldose 1-epimerase
MKVCRHVAYTALFAALFIASATLASEPVMSAGKTVKSVFGKTGTGQEVSLYTLTNAKGAQVAITPWGATVTSIRVPDRKGQLGDVVLGFDTLDGYLGSHPYFGVIAGRYGNRIAKGQFALAGKTYTLARNNGENHLHGGVMGFDKKLWSAREVANANGPSVELKYTSPDGEEGYPGKLEATVTYTWTNANEPIIPTSIWRARAMCWPIGCRLMPRVSHQTIQC